jgi:hypothetical protein
MPVATKPLVPGGRPHFGRLRAPPPRESEPPRFVPLAERGRAEKKKPKSMPVAPVLVGLVVAIGIWLVAGTPGV